MGNCNLQQPDPSIHRFDKIIHLSLLSFAIDISRTPILFSHWYCSHVPNADIQIGLRSRRLKWKGMHYATHRSWSIQKVTYVN